MLFTVDLCKTELNQSVFGQALYIFNQTSIRNIDIQKIPTDERIKEVAMTTAEVLHREGLEQGLEQGLRLQAFKDAEKMDAKGFDWSDIIDITGITPPELHYWIENGRQ
jgi:hypothetical protein